jgi:hypothetical protein
MQILYLGTPESDLHEYTLVLITQEGKRLTS